MRVGRLPVLVVLVILFSAASEDSLAEAKSAARIRAPKSSDVSAALKVNLGAPASVAKVTGEISSGRWAALYFVRDAKAHSVTMGVATFSLVQTQERTLVAIEGTLELPTASSPSEMVSEAKWGDFKIKDYDSDGLAELLVIYGYDGKMAPAVGNIYYREWAIVNVEGAPKLAVHVTLDELPQATVFPEIRSTWRFAKASANRPAKFTVTRSIGEYDDDRMGRKFRTERVNYEWKAAGDTWDAGSAVGK